MLVQLSITQDSAKDGESMQKVESEVKVKETMKRMKNMECLLVSLVLTAQETLKLSVAEMSKVCFGICCEDILVFVDQFNSKVPDELPKLR